MVLHQNPSNFIKIFMYFITNTMNDPDFHQNIGFKKSRYKYMPTRQQLKLVNLMSTLRTFISVAA